MIKIVKEVLNIFTPIDKIEEQVARKTVARFSRGNINLQKGKYITTKQHQKNLESCLKNG